MAAPTILFTMLNESGHLNPTYKLAKGLRARGYDVRYLAMADLAPQIEAQGFRVEPLYPDLFPEGVLAADQALGLIGRRRAITRRYRALLARLRERPPCAQTPQLMLIDVTQTHFAFWARQAGCAFMHVNTSLPQTRDPGVPPLRSAAPYGGDLHGRARAALDWRRFLARRRFGAELARLAGMAPPYQLARRLAPSFGVTTGELDAETVYMPQLRGLPELVLCPEAFDFPRPGRAERFYVESIDLTRNEPEFAWDGLAADKPLVYCALGGQRYRADEVPQFFRRLVHALRERLDWQLVLAVGPHLNPSELDPSPNVRVMERAPQLAILRMARVMITHGGLGSVKECITSGVPMLGVPLDVDQPGNVARVVHHGLGLAGDVRHSSASALAAGLERLLNEPSFRERCLAMQARFRETESAQRGVDIVVQHVEHAACSAG